MFENLAAPSPAPSSPSPLVSSPPPLQSKTHGITSSTEDRALALLGAGHEPEVVANALGVSVSRISQLLSQEDFATAVTQLRFDSLAKHNTRDLSYDEIEDQLILKLRDCIPLMFRPMEILKAIATINAAKRRGTSAPAAITQQQTVIQLIMPTTIVQAFTKNTANQVVEVDGQTLVTIQAGTLLKQSKERNATNGNGQQLLTVEASG